MAQRYQHFNLKERTLIYWWRKEDLSLREMARRLRRSHASISSRTATQSLVWTPLLSTRGNCLQTIAYRLEPSAIR